LLYPSIALVPVCVVIILSGGTTFAQIGSPNPLGPFADSIERRRAEQDLRALPLKLRERMDRNLADPQMLKQMNEDFLRIQAIRAEMVSIFSSGSTINPRLIKDSASEIRRRGNRLRTMLALSDEHPKTELRADGKVSLESVNGKAFQLCLEISRFTGNPLFKKKGVITVANAKEASAALDAVIELAGVLQKESGRLDDN
jgi:hypothetical protein